MIKVTIILASLAVIAAIVICGVPLVAVPYTVDIYYEDVETYYEKEPYTVREPYTETHEVKLYQDKYGMGGSTCGHLLGNIRPLHGNDRIEGTARLYGGHPPKFLILDRMGYDIYWLGRSPSEIYVRDEALTKLQFSFKVEDPGLYYFVLDESPYSEYKDAVVYFDISWIWSETSHKEITKYRDIPKQRTVIKTRQETRYKDVTVLEYLIDYS